MVPYANVLVTGAAGFIGFHLSKRLLDGGARVVGLDNLNAYYSVKLKEDRLAQLQGRTGFELARLDLADREGMQRLFQDQRFDVVVNLAAQAGVRYSLQNPHAYIDANIVGFTNILEGCRHGGVKHLVFASSSSVYGANTRMPFSVHDNVDHPVSPLCGHQEGQRAHGAHLRPPVRAALHRAALLHRLRPLGTPGHGALPLHRCDPEGAADPGVQPRPHAARLHLHRRHRRGGRARDGAAARSEPLLERRPPGPGHRRTPRIASTTSATTSRSSSTPSSRRSKMCSGSRPQSNTWTCSRGMCRRPTRMCPISRPTWGSSRRPPSARGSSASFTGTGITTGFLEAGRERALLG